MIKHVPAGLTPEEYRHWTGRDTDCAENQQIVGQLVDREVVYCISALIYEIVSRSLQEHMDPEDQTAIEQLIYVYDYQTAAEDQGWVSASELSDWRVALAAARSGAVLPDWAEVTYVRVEAKRGIAISCVDNYEMLCEEQRIDVDNDEIFEHWIVSDYAAKWLKAHGEAVADFCNLTVWGRRCTGQAIKLDYIWQHMAADMGILKDQIRDWSASKEER